MISWITMDPIAAAVIRPRIQGSLKLHDEGITLAAVVAAVLR
jgi:hypothetical protein